MKKPKMLRDMTIAFALSATAVGSVRAEPIDDFIKYIQPRVSKNLEPQNLNALQSALIRESAANPERFKRMSDFIVAAERREDLRAKFENARYWRSIFSSGSYDTGKPSMYLLNGGGYDKTIRFPVGRNVDDMLNPLDKIISLYAQAETENAARCEASKDFKELKPCTKIEKMVHDGNAREAKQVLGLKP